MQSVKLTVLCFLGLNCFTSAIKAAPPSPSLSASMEQREQKLGDLTFSWNATTEEISPPIPHGHVLELQRDWQQQLPDQLRKQGITNEATIQSLVKQMTAKVPGMSQGYSRTSVAPYQFCRNGTQMLVTGEVQRTRSLIDYEQLYDQDNGLVVFREASRQAGQGVPALSPQAWLHDGGAARYPCPFSQSLDLSPEHFAALAGFSPLDMYGVQWSLISQTQSQLVLTAQAKDDRLVPIQIQVILDRTHGNAMQQVHLEHGRQTIDIHAQSFRRYEDEWICDKAKVIDNRPGVLMRTQTWTLQSVELSKPLDVILPVKQEVADYRLLGSGYHTHGLFSQLAKDQIINVVYYSWSGKFPSIAELHKLQEHQHPGEASPDSSKSASLPYVGGLLALVGGVWMFRRRGSIV